MEPRWRTNSSFSPPLSRRWDLEVQQDGSPQSSQDRPNCVSSLSSNSKRSGNPMNKCNHSDRHHYASDGTFSYFGSPSNYFKVPRWTSPVQKFDLGEFSTPTGGGRPDAPGFSQSNERCFPAGVSSLSNSIGSVSPLSESGQWASTSKAPFPPRHSSSRRSFRTKPVYPLLFHNPVSGNEGSGLAETYSTGSRLVTVDNKISPTWPGCDSSPDLKFNKNHAELQKIESSPGPDTSSRHGFRWSNASSYDFGVEDGNYLSDSLSPEIIHSLSSTSQKCGLCRRLLCQKSPWSSCGVIRNSDMPTAGVLQCGHVFHADCLEETTPKTQIHDPPCPACAGVVGSGDSISFSEPLQFALRAERKKQGDDVNLESTPRESDLVIDADSKNNLSHPIRFGSTSLIKNHLKKHLSFKGSIGKDLFGSKLLGGMKSSAPSSSMLRARKKY